MGEKTTERPITMTASMVQACMRDVSPRTQIRRLVNESRLRVRLDRAVASEAELHLIGLGLSAPAGDHPASLNQHGAVSARLGEKALGLRPGEFDFLCPYVVGRTHLGDYGGGRKVWTITPSDSHRLWVREGFVPNYADWKPAYRADFDKVKLAGLVPEPDWRPAALMTRVDARLLLDVVSVRLERLQDITPRDSRAEGISREDTLVEKAQAKPLPIMVAAFAARWERANGPGSWVSNPWVWAIEFKRVPAQEVSGG